MLAGTMRNAWGMGDTNKRAGELLKEIQACIDENNQRAAQRKAKFCLALENLVNENADSISTEQEFKDIQLKIDAFYKKIKRPNSIEESKKAETLDMDAIEAMELTSELTLAKARYEARLNNDKTQEQS